MVRNEKELGKVNELVEFPGVPRSTSVFPGVPRAPPKSPPAWRIVALENGMITDMHPTAMGVKAETAGGKLGKQFSWGTAYVRECWARIVQKQLRLLLVAARGLLVRQEPLTILLDKPPEGWGTRTGLLVAARGLQVCQVVVDPKRRPTVMDKNPLCGGRLIRPPGVPPPPCPMCGGDLEWRHQEWPPEDELCRECGVAVAANSFALLG
jgi:hypothetical protein